MGGTNPINGRSTQTEMVLQQKNRHSELEAWQPGTSEVDAWKGKRKIKDRWEETSEVVCQIMADIPSYEVMNQCRRSRVLH